jgi:hypothetical protein
MPAKDRTDDVDTLLSEQQVLEDRKRALIDDLLKQREAAMATLDEQLAKLGYPRYMHGADRRVSTRRRKPNLVCAPLRRF